MSIDELRFNLHLFYMYILGDLGKLGTPRYNVINGNIDDHLAQISAFMSVYITPMFTAPTFHDECELFKLLDAMEFGKIWEELVCTYKDAYYAEARINPGAFDDYTLDCDRFRMSEKHYYEQKKGE